MDQRARGDVLEAVAHAAYEVPDDHEAEEEPERRDELAEALDNDPDERRGPKPRQRHPTRDDVRAHEHAECPGAEDDPDPDVLDAEHVLRVDEVRGDRRAHEEERHEDHDHHERDESVAEEERDAVAGATSLLVLARRGTAPHRERQPREADGDERDRVDEHRSRRPPGGDEETAAQRADREAESARGLDGAVRLLQAARAGDRRDECELGRLRDRDSRTEERCECEERSEGAHRRQRDGDARLSDRDEDEERARLDPIDEQPNVPREDDDRCPQADEQGRDGDAAAHPLAGHVLRGQPERDERDAVAGRRQADGRREHAQVALPRVPPYRHGRSIPACGRTVHERRLNGD
jgi:hypothetical protein